MDRHNKIKNVLITLLVIGSIFGIGFFIRKQIQDITEYPRFAFNDEAAADWWGRGNVNVQSLARTRNYTGQEPLDRLPVADMALFHGEHDGESAPDGCFATFSYYDYTLDDVDAAYASYFDLKDTDRGTLNSFDPVTQSLKTYEGEKEFVLRRYKFVLEDEDTMQGYQVGFIQLDSGYIRTEGVCETPEDLELITPAIDAIELLER